MQIWLKNAAIKHETSNASIQFTQYSPIIAYHSDCARMAAPFWAHTGSTRINLLLLTPQPPPTPSQKSPYVLVIERFGIQFIEKVWPNKSMWTLFTHHLNCHVKTGLDEVINNGWFKSIQAKYTVSFNRKCVAFFIWDPFDKWINFMANNHLI